MNYITGASGFLGSHLYQKLKGIKVRHEDIQKTDFQPGDTVYFCSAYGNLWGQNDSDEMRKSNVDDAIWAAKNSRVVYASSSSVNLVHQTRYSRSKHTAEKWLLEESRVFCHSVVRPFSITGVGEQKEHLIPTLIRSCLYGEKMELALWPSHKYVDVDDVAEAMLTVEPGELRECWTGVSHTNEEILKIVEDVTGKRAKWKVAKNTMRPYDTPNWLATQPGNPNYKPLVKSIGEMVALYELA